MKKIKGSSSSVRMIHLVVLFCVTLVTGLGLRTYQVLDLVNPVNGFFEKESFTVPILYGLLAVSAVLFIVLSFVSKNVPAPSLNEGRNIFLGMSSLLAAAGFVWDIIIIRRDILPDSSISQGVYDDLLVNYIKDSGGIFLILEFVFAVLSVFYLVIFAVSHFEGKATYKKFGLLALSPACWTMFVLISKLMKAVSFITVSELLFEIAMLVFTMIFFFVFARTASGVYTVNGMWATYGCGFVAAILAALISVPRAVVLLVGLENVEGSSFSFTHLFIFIFVFVYILATLGVGFRNGMKKIHSASNVLLPDDSEVVVKGSDITVVEEASENRAEEIVSDNNGFKIDVEFRNNNDIESFFDSDEITVEEIEENAVAEAVEEYVEDVEKEISESGNEDSTQDIAACIIEENPQKTDTDSVEEIEEARVEAYGEMPSEERAEEKEDVTEIPITNEDDGFELTGVFAELSTDTENTESEETTDIDGFVETVSEKVEEFEEIRETEEISESAETEEIKEALDMDTEETAKLDESEIVEEEKEEFSVPSAEGFVEFSQMLIDDFEEDEDVAEEVKAEEAVETSVVEEQPVKKEVKTKEEKVKKPKKAFGKSKKKSTDDEPLKIVSLAELRKNKDSE